MLRFTQILYSTVFRLSKNYEIKKLLINFALNSNQLNLESLIYQ